MNENMIESVVVYSLGRSGRREEIFEQGKWSNDFQKFHVRFCIVTIKVTYLSTFLLSVPKNHIKHYKWKFIILLANSWSKDSEVTVQCGITVTLYPNDYSRRHHAMEWQGPLKSSFRKQMIVSKTHQFFYFLFWWWAS